jgi:hypothetical protein
LHFKHCLPVFSAAQDQSKELSQQLASAHEALSDLQFAAAEAAATSAAGLQEAADAKAQLQEQVQVGETGDL